MLIPQYTYTFVYTSGRGTITATVTTPYGFTTALKQLSTQPHMQAKGLHLLHVTRQTVAEQAQTLDGLMSERTMALLAPADHMMSGHCLTKDDLCSLYRIKSYDCALPQPWLEETARKFAQHKLSPSYDEAYDWLRCYSVMRYDGPGNAYGTITYLSIELALAAGRLKLIEEPTQATA